MRDSANEKRTGPSDEVERERVAEIHRYREFVTRHSQSFKDIVILAKASCGVEAAVLSFIFHDHREVIAESCSHELEIVAPFSICQKVVRDKEIYRTSFSVFAGKESAQNESRQMTYLGVPIVLSSGQTVATLAMMSRVEVSPKLVPLTVSKALARRVVEQLEMARYRVRAVEKSRLAKRQIDHIKEKSIDGEILRQSSGQGLWKWHLSDGSMFFDERCCQMIGKQHLDFEHKESEWKNLMHPDDRKFVEEKVEDFLRGDSDHVDLVFRWQHVDGHWVPIHSKGRVIERDSSGSPLFIAGSYFDLSLARSLEEERRRSNHIIFHQKQALDSAAIVVETDSRGKITYVNDKFVRISKYSARELIGQDHRLINSGYHPKSFFKRLWQTISCGGVWHGEVKNRTKDGKMYWVDTTIYPAKDESGNIEKFIAIRFDITARKEAEERLRVASQSAEKASQIKSQFLANMSHEIRTPLNSIIGLSDVLMETSLTQEQRRYLSTVRGCGNTLLNIINDILDLSKVEAGQLELEKTPFDVVELVEKVAEMMAVAADDKGVEIAFDIDDEVPSYLRGDPLRLRQILYNLVGNSIKFTSSGFVSIRVNFEERIEQEKVCLEIQVEDSGCGMSKDQQNKIFESFTQADSSITRRYGGTGLGLSIVRELVEAMGGEISVKSSLGVGSVFSMQIPFQIATSWKPKKARLSEFLRDRRVLLLDDNAVVREILQAQLENWGATVDCVASEEEAVELFSHSGHYDLALVDRDLQGRDGMEALEKIHEKSFSQSFVSIVMLTSANLSSDLVKAKELGVRAHVVKPVRKKELEEALRQALIPSRRGRLLVVDDEPEILELMKECFEDRDIETLLAINGSSALEALERGAVDSVLCDMFLPDMTGLELMRRVRAHGIETPMVLFSGSLNEEIRAKAIDLNVSHVIEKPFCIDQLRETIDQSVRQGIEGRKQARGLSMAFDERPLRLLLAEDSVKNQQLIQVYMKGTNYSLEMAKNGEEAVNKVQREKFDLVLMDMQMPVMDGYSATKMIRQLEKDRDTKRLPIIALTAFALKGERDKSLSSGCDDHLTKPVRKETLLQSIWKNTQNLKSNEVDRSKGVAP